MRTRPVAITLNYSINNMRHDIRQIIYIYNIWKIAIERTSVWLAYAHPNYTFLILYCQKSVILIWLVNKCSFSQSIYAFYIVTILAIVLLNKLPSQTSVWVLVTYSSLWGSWGHSCYHYVNVYQLSMVTRLLLVQARAPEHGGGGGGAPILDLEPNLISQHNFLSKNTLINSGWSITLAGGGKDWRELLVMNGNSSWTTMTCYESAPCLLKEKGKKVFPRFARIISYFTASHARPPDHIRFAASAWAQVHSHTAYKLL